MDTRRNFAGIYFLYTVYGMENQERIIMGEFFTAISQGTNKYVATQGSLETLKCPDDKTEEGRNTPDHIELSNGNNEIEGFEA